LVLAGDWTGTRKGDMGTHLGYPTPVNPDHPIYEPCGNSGSRSSAFASFFSSEGRRTRAVSSADALRRAEEAMVCFAVKTRGGDSNADGTMGYGETQLKSKQAAYEPPRLGGVKKSFLLIIA